MTDAVMVDAVMVDAVMVEESGVDAPEVEATEINGPHIDGELLAEAMRHMQAGTPNEAINAALEEFVMGWRARRRAAAERLQEMSDEGAFDYSKLDEVTNKIPRGRAAREWGHFRNGTVPYRWVVT